MTHLQSSLWCVPRVKVRGCWRDHHMMKEPSAPITFWLADASSLPPRLDVSLPMPRFSYMQAAPACSRVIPDRLSDKAHEEGKGTSSEDTWGQKWACFDKLRLPLRWFNSGIFWAFESYNCLCIIIPFWTLCYSQHHQPNSLHHTIPLYALSRGCSSKGRRKVLVHCNVL